RLRYFFPGSGLGYGMFARGTASRPPATLQTFASERERIFERRHGAGVRLRSPYRIGIFAIEGGVLWTGFLFVRQMMIGRTRRLFVLLRADHARGRCCSKRYGAGCQKFSSCDIFVLPHDSSHANWFEQSWFVPCAKCIKLC